MFLFLFFFHSIEYKHQISCLTDHLKSCLTGLFSAFVPAVASLIKLLFYHCGDLKVDPALINQFLLDQIQCKAEVFTKTVECWNDFRTRFNRDKTDPQLCRYNIESHRPRREPAMKYMFGKHNHLRYLDLLPQV